MTPTQFVKSCCMCRQPTDGPIRCPPCRERFNAQQRELYAKRTAAGRCTECPAPAVPGGTRCAACRNAKAALTRDAKRYARNLRRVRGQCWTMGCESPAAAGKIRCEACAARDGEQGAECYARLAKERAAAGLCYECGEPAASGKRACDNCRAARRELDAAKKRERRANGLCPRCGKAPPLAGRTMCERCVARVSANNKKQRPKKAK